MQIVKLLVVFGLLLLPVGCGEVPKPLLHALLGVDFPQSPKADSPGWPHPKRIGLLVHSDTTQPGSAPAISTKYLKTLGRRTEKALVEQCGVEAIESVEFNLSADSRDQMLGEFRVQGQEQKFSHVILVVFSSTEQGGPTVLGEERMMTQMSGTSIENTALAEVGLFRIADERLLIDIPAGAQETLELLDAPIGEGQPSREESIDILRAQAAQQALDKSLNKFGQWCQGIPEKDWK